MPLFRFSALIGTLLVVYSGAPSLQAGDDASDRPVSFRRDVEPIFRTHCFGCHQGAKQLGDYRMTEFRDLLAGGETGEPAIVAGKPDESYLIDQITPVDGVAEMPKPPRKALHASEIETVRRWIEQGAINDAASTAGPRYDPQHPPVYVGSPSLPSIDVSPDGSQIAVAGFHEVLLIDTQSGTLRSRLVGMSPRINTVRFAPDGRRLAAVGGTPSESGEIQIWDIPSEALVLSKPITYDTLSGASWSPDGTKLAFGGTDNVVRAIDAVTGEQVLFQGAHEDWVLDTVFTPDGNHLISVGRDMSCKLTEVETERFVDNITSITPGALPGGLSSVAVHPERNEILVGGADGVPKLYRVFRQTERRIGDDANLIRVLPQLPGRIFSVAISPDGSRIAAASTIDGRSEVRVWSYDFSGELSSVLKTILGKRVASRSPEERQQVQQYRNQPTSQLAAISLPDAATYAIRFAPDNSLVIAANDGTVRHLPDGESVANVLYEVPVQRSQSVAATGFEASAWHQVQAEADEQDPSQAPPSQRVNSLSVEPTSVSMASPYAYTQLIVTAVFENGATADVTRWCTVDVPEWASASSHGLIRPLADGSGKGWVRFGGEVATFEMEARGTDNSSVDFIRDVNPVLSRLGCNQGTCHGAQKGKNGFKLSLRGYDPLFDVRALTDDLAARRINPASPQDSLMLRKPVGRSPHEGGTLMREDGPYFAILRRWIADGSRLDLDAPRVDRIELFPKNPVVESIGSTQQVRVVAYYTDGTKRDVTKEAFIESGNTEVASVDLRAMLTALRRGEAPILARFEGAYAATTMTVMGNREGYVKPAVETWGTIDKLVAAKWNRVKVVPSPLTDDATFLRRVYLDLTGLPPTSDQVRAFLADTTPTRLKRAAVVDRLLVSDEFVEYWTNKWADLLQVNRKFLGVEGSEKFRKWIRTAIAENRPYDALVRQILTASGSNRDNPAASYFKVLRTPEDTMENTTHLFLGIRFNCNKCHDHPFERWTQDQYYEMAAFFARVGLEADPASGKRKVGGTAVEGAKPLFERVVDLDKGEVQHARTGKDAEPSFPFPVDHETSEAASRRERLAQWLTDPDNPYFARSYVNRLWGYLLGKGLIEPIDDIRAGNPPTNPALLEHLTESFIESGFDFRHMLRLICNSRTYQLDVAANPLNEDDQINYSRAMPRRLPAEVIYDAVHAATGSVGEIPGVRKGTRAAALTDSGVKLPDGFLQNLGRPVRESACECERSSGLQLGPVMALINGQTIGSAISDPQNELERVVAETPDDRRLAEEIFLRLLGRYPKESEFQAFAAISQQVREDHQLLVERLQSAESEWRARRTELEAQRIAKLSEVKQQIASRTKAIEPERARLEAARLTRIETAESELKAAQDSLDERIRAWESDTKSSQNIEWFPLRAIQLASTNDANLLALQDRSIVATGKTDKGIYTVVAETSLAKITGFRLEALADEDLPSQGPGLGDNGNFVITEFDVEVAPASDVDARSSVKIAEAEADFVQSGFGIEATFDGRKRDQRGWAVAGATGTVHWATFQLSEPIDASDGVVLTFQLHQFHNAAEHRLGRFRLSATSAEGEIPLGLPESLEAALTTPEANRRPLEKMALQDYVAANDKPLQQAKASLAEARKPIPPDAELQRLHDLEKKLSQETKVDPRLLRLRQDVRESASQQRAERLTAAEDLVWALINSPAFLFNH